MNLSIIAAALIIGIGAAIPYPSLSVRKALTPAQATTAQEPELIGRAKRLIEQFRDGQFDQAAVSWDSTMAKQLPPSKLAEVWKQLTSQVGALGNTGTGSVVEQGASRVVMLPLTFERAELVAQIAYDSQNRVTGLFFVPKT